jgi:ATP-binding cassette, subfamily C, bacterial
MADAPWRSPLRALLPDAAAFLRRRLRVIAVLVAWSALEAGQTFLTGYALAKALDHGFLRGRQGVGLWWLALAALAIVAGAYGSGRVFRSMAAIVEPLRDGLVRRVVSRALRTAVRDTTRTDTAAVSRLTHQVELARDTFAGVVMVLRSFAFTTAGALAGLATLDPALLVAVAPPLLLGVGLFAATLRPMARRQLVFLKADEAIAEELGAVAGGLRDVAACGGEAWVAARTDARIDAEYRAARSLARWSVVRASAVAVAGRVPVVTLLASGPWLLDHGVTAGELVGALAYLTGSLLPALENLMHGLGTAGTRLAVVLDRLVGGPPEETTATGAARQPADVPDGTSPQPAHGAAGPDRQPVHVPNRPAPQATSPAAAAWDTPAAPAVELRRVTFAYGPAARPVLRDLDLAVPHGGHLAVVGPSGIGKSTLAGLVAGLLEPRAGEIAVHGRPVRGRGAADPAALRVLIPQEAYVFSGTVRENLGYLCPGPLTDAEARSAAGAVGLTALVDTLGGLDAPVDPAALSAGQRQLVALTRAYLSPAPVVLLDEATCHLDPAAEARAERAFAARPGTLVVIAHRISSARRADRVLVMDGVHAVCGTHDELLARSPLYRDLVGHWGDGPAGGSGPGPDRGMAPGDTAPGETGRGPALQPARAPGYADGVHPVARARLAGDRGHVVAHRPVGQVEAARDLRDGGALGRE